jgi:D-arabinose 1-dehydrogenase-like Zn-dependent alcohol dehydrogenase
MQAFALPHLRVQFTNKVGYKVVAVGRGFRDETVAWRPGADVYIDSNAKSASGELRKLGGARVILATAPKSTVMSELIDGLGPTGKLVVTGAAFNPIEVTPAQLITGRSPWRVRHYRDVSA